MTVLGVHERSRLGAFHRSPLGARGRPTVYLDLGRAVQTPAAWSFDGKSYIFSHWTREITLQNYVCTGTAPATHTDYDGELLEWKRPELVWDEDPSTEEPPYPARWLYVDPGLGQDHTIIAEGVEFGAGSEMTGNGLFFLATLAVWGDPKGAAPACGGGWNPNDPADDDVTEVVDSTDAGHTQGLGYELLERPDTDSDWVSKTSSLGYLIWADSYTPSPHGGAEKMWARMTTPTTDFRVWPIREDPQTATITTVSVPDTIWAWVYDEDRTIVVANNGKAYVYDVDGTLVETLDPDGTGVLNFSARHGDLYLRRNSTEKLHVYRWDGAGYVEEAELEDTGFITAAQAGLAVAAGSSKKIVRGIDGEWSVVPFSRAVALVLDGWNWFGTTDEESVFWKGEQLAFAPI